METSWTMLNVEEGEDDASSFTSLNMNNFDDIVLYFFQVYFKLVLFEINLIILCPLPSLFQELSNTVKTLTAKLEDLSTCYDLIGKHGTALTGSLNALKLEK